MGSDVRRIDPSGDELELSIVIGDGVIGDWTVRAHGVDGSNRTWTGTSADRLPDQVRLPAAALATGELSLTWVVVLFGPAVDVPFHVTVDFKQGRQRLLEKPDRHAGTVPARKTRALSGSISFLDGVVG